VNRGSERTDFGSKIDLIVALNDTVELDALEKAVKLAFYKLGICTMCINELVFYFCR
jgi:hypothetical protein